MEKKQSSLAESKNSEKEYSPVVHHVITSSGKPLVAILGKRSAKGNTHLKEIRDIIAKKIPGSNSK